MKNTKRKILIISGFYPLFTGGAEFQMKLIANQLRDEFEIVFLYLGDVPNENVKSTYLKEIEGYKVYFLQSPNKIDEISLRYFYAKRLLKIFEEEKPDFVYQRVLKFISFYIAKYQEKLNYRHIIHIADLFTLDFNTNNLRGKLNYYFFNKTLSYQPIFITQTTEQRIKLERLGGTSSLQLYNMHPSDEYDIENLSKKKIEDDLKHIVWVANIKPIKQLEVLIELADRLQNKTGIHFDVIGNIQDAEYGKPLVEKMKTMKNVTHYTNKDNEFVNAFLLNNAFITVNTSISEGFSNVFIQSWVRGVPVLSLNSNPDDLFDKHLELGLYCANDFMLLMNYLLKLLDESSYQNRAIKSYQIGRELFSFKNIESLKNLLDS